ncbi:hypothetical protein D9758_009096 [Tetrapyrgos nigripes]|uniref:Uncharacterized protein n=1 Tax=Tetrapyrgos nigripes TaxID=182062 RepID=A0A8H5GA48_9AGAR|nr:hypothetical protein D9758_009096 [Tetrapyrgos nigripes]
MEFGDYSPPASTPTRDIEKATLLKIYAMKLFLGTLEIDLVKADLGLSAVNPKKSAEGGWDEVVVVSRVLERLSSSSSKRVTHTDDVDVYFSLFLLSLFVFIKKGEKVIHDHTDADTDVLMNCNPCSSHSPFHHFNSNSLFVNDPPPLTIITTMTTTMGLTPSSTLTPTTPLTTHDNFMEEDEGREAEKDKKSGRGLGRRRTGGRERGRGKRPPPTNHLAPPRTGEVVGRV